MFHRAHESAATCTPADVGGDDVGLRFIKRASRDHREFYVGRVISPVRRRFCSCALSPSHYSGPF